MYSVVLSQYMPKDPAWKLVVMVISNGSSLLEQGLFDARKSLRAWILGPLGLATSNEQPTTNERPTANNEKQRMKLQVN